MNIAGALEGVVMLLLLIGVGGALGRLRILTDEVEAALSRLLLLVSAPALLFTSVASNLSLDFYGQMGVSLFIPFFTMLLGLGAGLLLSVVARAPGDVTGVFLVMFGLSNTIFIGLPVCMAIWGDISMPLVMTYYPQNTILFWTLGNLAIARDAGKKQTSVWGVLRAVFSPPMLGFLAGLLVVAVGFAMPAVVMKTATHLGNLTAPGTLLMTGAALSRMGRESLRVGRMGLFILAGRLLFMPGVTLAACLLAGAAPLTTSVFTIMAAMPVMSQCVIMARAHGADHRLAAQMLTLSTLASLLGIPLWIFLLSLWL